MAVPGSEERPFVGRSDELKQFDKVLASPKGHAVIVTGQAGMGKTWLVDKMARTSAKHPGLTCDHVRFEVAESDTPDQLMELMIDRAFNVAGLEERSFEKTERRMRQRLALLKLLPKGDALGDLLQSLRRDQKKNARDQLLEKLNLISVRMDKNARAVFVIDSDKHMSRGSADAWRQVVKNLPHRIKFIFAQRPEDVLASDHEFMTLKNVVRIPKDDLGVLGEQAIDDLLSIRRDDLPVPVSDAKKAIAQYKGHPYAIQAALDLIADGVSLEDLPPDPPPREIARMQWDHLCNEHKEKAIELFRAYALLEFAVPDEVVEAVSGLSSAARQALLANAYLSGLLWKEAEGRKIYHNLLADYIRGQVSGADAKVYHRRAVDIYRKRLTADVKPDALAAERLPEHVLAVDGPKAFIESFVNECTGPLRTLGLLDAAISLSHRALNEFVSPVTEEEAVVLGNLGLIYETRGDLDQAEKMHKKSLEIEEKLGRLEGMASQYGNLGLIYQTRGDLDQAEKMYRKVLKIEEDLRRPDSIANTYGNLGLIYQTRGDLNQAEEMLRKSLEINQKLGRLEGMAIQYGNLGLVYKTRGDLDQAEKMHRKSLEIEKKLGLLEGMTSQYGNLGIIYKTRGDLDKAEELFRKSLEINEKLGRLEGMANDYGNLGNIYLTRGDLDQAEEMHRKSLEINEKLGRLEGMARQYGNLGLIYQTRGNLDQAEKMHRKSLEIDEKLGRLEGMASQYGNLGLIYQTRGDLDQAEKMHKKSLEIEEKLGRLEGMASEYGNLGLIYKTRGDLDQAEKMHRRSLEISEKLGRLEGMANQYGNLGSVYKQRGDITAAREYWIKSRDLFEQIGMPHMVEKTQRNLDGLPPDTP